MAELNGRAEIVAGLIEHNPAPDEPEQPDLLGLPQRGIVTPVYRGVGRPPGSRNKRTERWAEFLLSRYESPLEVLVQMANAPVAALAEQLGCSALEAFQEKRQAAIAAAPYLHQRMPLAVDVTDRKVLNLVIVDHAPAADGDGEAILEVMGNQGLGEPPDGPV